MVEFAQDMSQVEAGRQEPYGLIKQNIAADISRLTIKDHRFAQSQAGAGWNQHVDHLLRRHANKILRRSFNEAAREYLGLQNH